jgi:hypothetical protein
MINGCGLIHTNQGLEPIQVQRGDGLGFAPGELTAFEAIGPDADLLLFELA